jgi:hypothetical protein
VWYVFFFSEHLQGTNSANLVRFCGTERRRHWSQAIPLNGMKKTTRPRKEKEDSDKTEDITVSTAIGKGFE